MHRTPGQGHTKSFVEQQIGIARHANADMRALADDVHDEVIVLAEADDEARRALRDTLECLGYTVLPVADGNAAVALCKSLSQPPDLLIADVRMPGLGGPRVAEELARAGRLPGMLLISGTRNRARKLVRGAVRFRSIARPFTSGQLARRVRLVVREPSGFTCPLRDVLLT